jgi:hypothetical protein
MAGVVPYNLNDLMAEGGYLDNTLSQWRKRTTRDLFFMKNKAEGYSKAPLMKEMDIVERILLVSTQTPIPMHFSFISTYMQHANANLTVHDHMA